MPRLELDGMYGDRVFSFTLNYIYVLHCKAIRNEIERVKYQF